MITRGHRFHGYNSLRHVYQNGHNVRNSPMLALKVVKNDRRSKYRIAVVVSRKVHKSAVIRNRIRRRIYEQVRLQGAHIEGSFDMVFTVFNDQLADIPASQLEKLVYSQLKQAGVIA